MITENTDLLKVTGATKVTRICDECGKKETTMVYRILRGRLRRKSNVDLCLHCSNSSKYRILPIGDKHGQWKHGLTSTGYKRINVKGQRMLVHTYVIENFLGRKLTKDEFVHHIDLDKLNNDINNLWVCSGSSGHGTIHSSLEKCGYELFRRGKMFFGSNGKYTTTRTRPPNLIKLPKKVADTISALHFHISWHKGTPFERWATTCTTNHNRRTIGKAKHVMIAEGFLGRRMFQNEAVHHIDGDSTNNKLDNLFLTDQVNHNYAHGSLKMVAASFLKDGVVVFDRETGEYRLGEGQ